MERRTYLVGAAGVAGSLAGCSGILGDSESSEPSGPAEVAKAMMQAIVDGDIEEANEYNHPESPGPPVGPSNVESFQSANAAVESAEVVDRSGDTATVEVETSAERDSGERATVTFPFEMRKSGDEWYAYEGLRATAAANLPSVQFESEARTNGDDEVTAVAFTHQGGDDVEQSSLHVRVMDDSAFPSMEGEAMEEETEPLQVGDTLVARLDGDGEPYEELTVVHVIFSGMDSPGAETLTHHQLSTATAGDLVEPFEVER